MIINPMPEGRVVYSSPNTYTQEFIMTDQQGNARVAFRNNGSGIAKVYQENSYYGTGLILPNSPVGAPAVPNKKLYNGGSEWQNDSPVGATYPYNLPDYYETYNRNYDAAIGRFIGVDPMAESAESMSSYQYAGGNPIIANDPDGALADISRQGGVPSITSRMGSEFEGVEAEELQTENDWFYFGGVSSDFPIFGMENVTNEYVGAGLAIGYVTVGALSNGTTGNVYSVTSKGNFLQYGTFTPANGESDSDVLFAMNTDNYGDVDLNNFIMVDKDILEQLTETNQFGYSYAKFTGDAMGEALEDFLARNTLVEFSHLEFTNKNGSEGNIITTSHDEGNEWGAGAWAGELMKEGLFIKEWDHSHVGDELFGAIPSGIDPRDEAYKNQNGDVQTADKITQYDQRKFDKTPVFKIFGQEYNMIYYYNKAGVYWYNVWPSQGN